MTAMTLTNNPSAVIRTVSGRYINLLDPKPGDVTLQDIVVPLAKICRYGSHVPLSMHVSVAQHSVYVSRIAGILTDNDAMTRFAGLMHDASEALIADIVSPLKRHLFSYLSHEAAIQESIEETFGISPSDNDRNCVHLADGIVLLMEMREIGKIDVDFVADGVPKDFNVRLFDFFKGDSFLLPEDAHDFFLEEYDSIRDDLRTQGY